MMVNHVFLGIVFWTALCGIVFWTALRGITFAVGPTCMRCIGAPNEEECRTNTVQCRDNEKCYLEKVFTPELQVQFNAGCRSKTICSIMTTIATGRKRNVGDCYDCCDDEPDSFGPCNSRLCGQLPDKTQSTCINCDGVYTGMDDCAESSVCLPNEVCYTGIRIVGDLVRYVFGCQEKSICRELAENNVSTVQIGSNIRGDQGISVCDACCNGYDCNDVDCFDLKSKMKPDDFTPNGPSTTRPSPHF